LSADIETFKQKIKQQKILLSQMKYPYQAPVSSVSYEKMGIGQQNALNQANLEAIQKNIETKLEDQFKDQSNKIDSELQVVLNKMNRRENESDEQLMKRAKKSMYNKKNCQKSTKKIS
jgi:hypothetical protein